MTTAPSPERAALEAVLEALDIPAAATVGDEKIRGDVMLLRAFYAVVMLRNVVECDADQIGWHVDWLRERLAERPATGYRTWDEAVAERAAAKVPGR